MHRDGGQQVQLPLLAQSLQWDFFLQELLDLMQELHQS
jgi:hypothetical protein